MAPDHQSSPAKPSFTAATLDTPPLVDPSHSALRRLWADLPLSAAIGFVVLLTYVLIALFAPILTPFSESEIVGYEYQPWGTAVETDDGMPATAWLGTDNLGRDMMTRLFYGARNTIGIAFMTTLIAFVIGGGGGLLAAVVGGAVDMLAGRLVDILMAIPQLIFALLLLTIFGTSVTTLILVIAVLDSTRVFRLTRATAMTIVVMDFVEAARIRGEGLFWIMRREILPNIVPVLIAEFGLRFCFVFLLIASLSFLGLGLQPPTADWGSMVKDNAILITYGDITPLLPAGAITLLVIAVNFIVDWLLHKSSGLHD